MSNEIKFIDTLCRSTFRLVDTRELISLGVNNIEEFKNMLTRYVDISRVNISHGSNPSTYLIEIQTGLRLSEEEDR